VLHDPAAPGTRRVTITTEPPGAEMAFVPLDPATGEPQPERMARAGKSPVELDLPPGDYLVVAALDDERFHEVYRHVPEDVHAIASAYSHLNWQLDDDGRVQWPQVTIPPASVVRGMARIAGSDSGAIQEFLIDAGEFTLAEYRRHMEGHAPFDRRSPKRPDEFAAAVNFDQAMKLAELAGKRLPTEWEYQHAATNGGSQKFSWGDSTPDTDDGESFQRIGPVGTPLSDCLKTTPPVNGLCSNVAEWTNSPAIAVIGSGAVRKALPLTSKPNGSYRIVRGGDPSVVEGRPGPPRSSYDPTYRFALPRATVKPGLGFRCVRSVKPRLDPSDFPPAKNTNAI
jgi:hypothetical protein